MFSLDEVTRISIPPTPLGEIADLTDKRTEYVHTQLVKLADADHTPEKLVYKQYGDLKAFRCGGKMRILGAIIENLGPYADFNHLVIILGVTPHDYTKVGVMKRQARQLTARFADISSREEFQHALTGSVFDVDEIRNFR